MKTYNSTNFFKHTFCEFNQINDFEFPENTNYKSKSESQYFYTKQGVYRKSNHWGRVANCSWKLISNENYKNQNTAIAFAKWSDFYPINSSLKLFTIAVNFDTKTVKLQPKKDKLEKYLFTYSEAQKRIKQIKQLFNDTKWSNYYNEDISIVRKKIISNFINSNKSLHEIKLKFRD